MDRWGSEYQVHSNPELKDKFHHQTFFYDGNFRKIHPSGMSTYFPVNLHNYGQELHRSKRPNVVVVGVSSMDEHGYCCVSCDLQWEMESFYSADKIIFEVNPRIPHLSGDCALPVAMADVIIESDLTLYELQDPPIGEAEKAVAQYAAEMVHDGDCIQLGFGGIPNAIGFELMNRHDLGIHTEMFSDGVVELVEAGVITNKAKTLHRGQSVATFLMGTRRLYDYVNNNPAVAMYPVDYVNDPYVIGQNDNLVSINSCVQVDIMGQVVSTSAGLRQISGVGGQVDFVRGANLSKGGRAIMAMPSTTGKGKISKIVPFLDQGPAVTTTRNEVNYIITEYGIANLKGKSLRQRAEALIRIAHPDFRDELTAEFRRRYPRDY